MIMENNVVENAAQSLDFDLTHIGVNAANKEEALKVANLFTRCWVPVSKMAIVPYLLEAALRS